MNDKRLNGLPITKRNVEYLRIMKDLCSQYARLNTILYFLIVKLNMVELYSLFSSVRKQKMFIVATMETLREKYVPKEYIKVFERDIQNLQRRKDYVLFIVKENVFLTEYYPYFESVGWDVLDEFQTGIDGDDFNVQLDFIINDFEEYKLNNIEEIENHLKQIEPQRKSHEEFVQKNKDDVKREKQIKKEQRKIENAELKEMKKNEEAYRKRKKMIDRSFERYYS